MSVPAQPAVLGVAVVVLAVLAVGAVLVLARRERRHQAAIAALLERSRSEVDSLGARVEQLAAELEAGRAAEERRAQEREYVITTLAGQTGTPTSTALAAAGPPAPRPLQRIEEHLLGGLATRSQGTRIGARTVDAVVGVIALGHGLRRALAPENLDRAAAEAHVARRRSRRTRKHEVREARRVLRAVRNAPGGDRDVA